MKKLIPLMIGLGLVLSTTAPVTFAQDPKDEKKDDKKGGKKKDPKDEKKEEKKGQNL